MSRRRTTFGKLQRDRDKQAKQRAKQERRAERSAQSESDETSDAAEAASEVVDQDTVLARLAELHAAFDDGKIDFDTFEEKRNELTSQLRID